MVSPEGSMVVGTESDDSIAQKRTFVERRSNNGGKPPGVERRQFGNSHAGLSAAGRELAEAIDRYKVEHGRRFLNCDELLQVLAQLGYRRTSQH